MEETEARIIKKGRGTNLIHLGYMYSRDRPGPDGKIYWRCTKKPRGSCNARAHTKGEGYELRVIHQTDHTHEPDEEAVATATIKADLCTRAASQPTKQLKELYRDYIHSDAAPTEDDDFLVPQLASCRSQMYRARRQNMPQLPTTRAEITLEDSWTKTTAGDNFLPHKDDDQLIFGTDENLRLLSAADTVYMDGTFAVTPRLFYQLYTLHICFRGFFLPLIYALLPNKTGDTYYDMIQTLKRKMAQLDLAFNPTTVMIEFETGMIPKLHLHFPTTSIKGCNFHFTQAIWRQAQHLGLTRAYHDSKYIRKIVRSLMALPFVPRNWIRHQFTAISLHEEADQPAVQELLNYFRSTWLDGNFPIQMWNTYGQDTRTNNHVEGWHNSFRQSVGKCHPNIFEFITKLEEQAATDLTRRNALLGAAPPTTKKKYREREASIKTLKEEFADGTRTLSEYFSAVRRHVGYKNM